MDAKVPPMLPAGLLVPERPQRGAPVGRLDQVEAVATSRDVAVDLIPLEPPPEVMAQVKAAARRVEWLREHGRELRFQADGPSLRVRIEVRDLEGRLLRTIPPSEALAAVSGPLEL